VVIGECYAFYSDRLLAVAEQKDFPWHLWLLQMTIAGLWEEHCKQKIVACYTVHTNVHRLFLCSKKKGWCPYNGYKPENGLFFPVFLANSESCTRYRDTTEKRMVH
jgi:hypothetical protein